MIIDHIRSSDAPLNNESEVTPNWGIRRENVQNEKLDFYYLWIKSIIMNPVIRDPLPRSHQTLLVGGRNDEKISFSPEESPVDFELMSSFLEKMLHSNKINISQQTAVLNRYLDKKDYLKLIQEMNITMEYQKYKSEVDNRLNQIKQEEDLHHQQLREQSEARKQQLNQMIQEARKHIDSVEGEISIIQENIEDNSDLLTNYQKQAKRYPGNPRLEGQRDTLQEEVDGNQAQILSLSDTLKEVKENIANWEKQRTMKI